MALVYFMFSITLESGGSAGQIWITNTHTHTQNEKKWAVKHPRAHITCTTYDT